MKPPRGGAGWETRLLTASVVLLTLGYGVVATGYFMAPQGWTMRIEHWFYLHFPLYQDSQRMGGLLLLALWITGCVLLVRRAWRNQRVPWTGLILASLTPLLLLAFNATFFYAASRVAPLSLGR